MRNTCLTRVFVMKNCKFMIIGKACDIFLRKPVKKNIHAMESDWFYMYIIGCKTEINMIYNDICSLVTRTRFTRLTFITSGGGYSKSVGYNRTFKLVPVYVSGSFLTLIQHLQNRFLIISSYYNTRSILVENLFCT